MPGSADTKACPLCGEEILAVAVKCKHCGSMLGGSMLGAPANRRALRAEDVPWYRRTTGVLVLVLLVAPAAAIVLLTGPVYRVRDGRAVEWRGLGRPVATFLSVGVCIAVALAIFEALHRPDCRSSDVGQLLNELAQRQVTEAQTLLAAGLPRAQAGLKLSVSLTGARETQAADAQGGNAKRCAATAHFKAVFPGLDEPFEATSELKYLVNPSGWLKVYVHIPDAEWIQVAFGSVLDKYAQRTSGSK